MQSGNFKIIFIIFIILSNEQRKIS